MQGWREALIVAGRGGDDQQRKPEEDEDEQREEDDAVNMPLRVHEDRSCSGDDCGDAAAAGGG